MVPFRRFHFARLPAILLIAVWLVPGPLFSPAFAAESLVGQFLVANPAIPDPRFAHTVIYVVAHDRDGAMGLVINRGLGHGPMRTLLEGFGVEDATGDRTVELHSGGPVEPTLGFVLHSDDFSGVATRPVADGVCLSVGFDVLQAIGAGKGPARRQIYLGYAGWGPGQLENELARGDWLTASGDANLIFTEDDGAVWDQAMRRAGLDL